MIRERRQRKTGEGETQRERGRERRGWGGEGGNNSMGEGMRNVEGKQEKAAYSVW